MRRKLPGYLLLSFISFGFFSCVFHAVASAQGPVTSFLSPAPEQTVPTPTLFQTQPQIAVTKPQVQPSPAIPTPTLYVAPLQNSLASIQKTDTIKTDEITPTPQPTIGVTATPLPTEVPTVAPTTAPLPATTAVTDLESFFQQYADQYHVDKEFLKKIARCESGFNPTSNNSGMYLGMFQFSAGTWSANRSRMGLDPNPDLRTNPEEAIRTAAYMISNGQSGAWPVCSK